MSRHYVAFGLRLRRNSRYSSHKPSKSAAGDSPAQRARRGGTGAGFVRRRAWFAIKSIAPGSRIQPLAGALPGFRANIPIQIKTSGILGAEHRMTFR